jgi:protein-glutamine gamma-glutamyltransferase
MRLDRASLLLNMLLILVSVGAHQAGAEEFAFFLLTLVVCVWVWRREKSGRPLVLSDAVATGICVVAFIALMWRGISTATSGGFRMTDVGVAPVGDFLIVFQWVTLCRKRKGHDYFWLYLVTLVLMGTAGLQMPGLAYGFFFIAYVFLALCAVAACHAALEARAASVWQQALGPAGANAASSPASAPAAQLALAPPRVNVRFYLGALAATLPVLVAVAMLFVVLPRTAATGTLGPVILRLGQQPTSGFSNTVRLGAIGQIQDNPTRVMHVIIRDPKSLESIQVPSLLLRGLPLDAYIHQGDSWSWQLSPMRGSKWYWWSAREAPRFGMIYRESFPGYSEPPYREITCDISLEPLDTRILFAPFAPESLSGDKQFMVGANNRTHVLQTGLLYRRTPLNYTVTSRLYDAAPPPKPPERTMPEEFLRPYLELPAELSPRLRALAREIAPASVPTDYLKAERILSYLSDSSRFSYTLDMNPTEGVEPVEDFLFNLKCGHCEYFASSMVVLLREVNVPARLVNGFKVSEWNPITGAYVVRQQHAHSWVEAYLRPYGWRTLDPTAVSREAATPRPMLARRIGSNIYDWTESLWVSNVLNFDSMSQAGVYSWWAGIAGFFHEWTIGPIERRIGGVLGLRTFEPPEASSLLYAVLGAIFWMAAVLFGAGLAWTIARGIRRRRRGRRVPRQLRFYERMERLLARRGFRRAGAQTPWEFSAALGERRWPAASEVAEITGRFCRARYGTTPPTEADLREIEEALRAIRRTR